MTKLEELSELLVSEIEQFEKTVEKLQKIQEQKIIIDSRALEITIRLQQENLEKALLSHKQEIKSFGKVLEKAKVYLDSWAFILFAVSLILNGILACLLLAEKFEW